MGSGALHFPNRGLSDIFRGVDLLECALEISLSTEHSTGQNKFDCLSEKTSDLPSHDLSDSAYDENCKCYLVNKTFSRLIFGLRRDLSRCPESNSCLEQHPVGDMCMQVGNSAFASPIQATPRRLRTLQDAV